MSVPSLIQADSELFAVPQQQSETVSVDQSRDSQPASPDTDGDVFVAAHIYRPRPTSIFQ
jgi:hypothetical protein